MFKKLKDFIRKNMLSEKLKECSLENQNKKHMLSEYLKKNSLSYKNQKIINEAKGIFDEEDE